MKKSELKQLIREQVKNLLREYINDNPKVQAIDKKIDQLDDQIFGYVRQIERIENSKGAVYSAQGIKQKTQKIHNKIEALQKSIENLEDQKAKIKENLRKSSK